MADSDLYPNLHIIFCILATQPVTTCECERSISKLKLVKSVLRTTMSEERFNGLTMLSVHKDLKLDLDELVDIFAKKQPRRLKLSNILSD